MGTDEQLHAMLDALGRRIEDAGCWFIIRGRIGPGEELENGRFMHNPWGREKDDPQVWLFRDHQAQPGPALAELTTTAHEFGHFRSYQHGNRSAKYLAVVDLPRHTWAARDPVDRQLILDEEIRAWNLGAIELDALGFVDWSAYRDIAVGALGVYGELLTLPIDSRLVTAPPPAEK